MADKIPVMKTIQSLTKDIASDPFNIRSRLYTQVSELLFQLENGCDEITTRERIAALAAIGRLEVIFTALREKESLHDPGRGSAVRKYATAFKAHGARRGAKTAGDSGPDLATAAAAAAEDDLDIGI